MRALRKIVRRPYRKYLSWTASVNPRPVIGLGNAKSGTTVVAALLAEHTGLSVTLDLRGIYLPMLTRLHSGEVRFEEFVERNRLEFSRDIIKEPNLTLLYSDVRRVFPRARSFIVVRDPRDNIRSILNRLRIPGNLEHLDLDRVPTLTPEWRLGLDASWLGVRGRNYIEMMAGRWNLAADVYLNHAGEMRLVRYEDFLGGKVAAIQALAADLELSGVHDIASKVDVQYQPRGDRRVSWLEFFGRDNLRRIDDICAGRMARLCYRPALESRQEDP